MAHRHHNHPVTGDQLRNALVLTLGILALEAVVGYRANSLALLSDAGHILTDAFALALAWIAARLSSRPPDARNTFGYRRSSILAALVNSTVLIVIATAIVIEAALRLRHPEHVAGLLVAPAAVAAIVLNSYIAFGLRGHRHDDLNIRAAFLHVVGDIGASTAVVVTSIAIVLWGVYWLDPLLSIGIALLIAYGSWHILRDTVAVLMESTPPGISLERVRSAMQEIPGVTEVHDLHIWALSDGLRFLSAHVFVPEQSLAETSYLLADLKLLLRRRFQIEHATIEPECVDCSLPQRRPLQFHPPTSPDVPDRLTR